MKTIRMSILTLFVVCLAGLAHADIVTVQHTMNYLNNDYIEDVWFVIPGSILDHSPYCRAPNEDWGWTHDIARRVPAGATGIESATLTIIAWQIDLEEGEDDVVYTLPEKPATTSGISRIATQLGLLNSYRMSPITVAWENPGGNQQINGYEDLWSVTDFNLPADTIDDLWANGQVYFHVDIDRTGASGQRATIESAVLRINYIAPTPVTPPTVEVHRFWSPVLASHFYTASVEEMQYLIDNYPDVWTYEGIAYAAMTDDTDPLAVPVHRFWSPVLAYHFYTTSEEEADYLIANYPHVWTYEGPAFYAYAADYQPVDTYPVYRFWSPTLMRHFFTMYEEEKQYLMANYPHVWTYEGIAYYAYMP